MRIEGTKRNEAHSCTLTVDNRPLKATGSRMFG
jgi:hypothetical protein